MPRYDKIVDAMVAHRTRHCQHTHVCGILVNNQLVCCRINTADVHAEMAALKYYFEYHCDQGKDQT
jgi:hypothetical protein